jgi:hypothetical protein
VALLTNTSEITVSPVRAFFKIAARGQIQLAAGFGAGRTVSDALGIQHVDALEGFVFLHRLFQAMVHRFQSAAALPHLFGQGLGI